MLQRVASAIAFTLVLLAAVAGAYFGGRWIWQRLRADFAPRPEWVPPALTVPVADLLPTPIPSLTPTAPARATSTRSRIPTLMPAASPASPAGPTAAPAPTSIGAAPVTPAARLTPAPAPTNAGSTAAPTPSATATGAPVASLPFVPLLPVRNTTGDCPGNYILGQVTDRSGDALSDIRLWLVDELGLEVTAITKSGQTDKGRYDFPLYGTPRRYYMTVVDASGHPISDRVEVAHGLGSPPQATCHWLNWQRR